jgi:hypothetical protein
MTTDTSSREQTKDIIIWEDPPKAYSRGQVSVKRIAMVENPGKWMLWSEAAGSSSANHLRKAGFQVTTRAIPGTNKARVYTRWPARRAVRPIQTQNNQ